MLIQESKTFPSPQKSLTVASTDNLSQISLMAPSESKDTPTGVKCKNWEGNKQNGNNLLFPSIYGLAPRESLCPQKKLSTQG